MNTFHRTCSLLLFVAFFCPVFAAETGPNGWRGDGNGKYPTANPPLDWGRVAKSVKELSAQSRKPKDGAVPAKEAAIPDGVIRQWLVLGPMPIPEGKKIEDWLPDAEKLSPDENEKFGDLNWRTFAADSSCLDFCSMLNTPPDKKGFAAFAHAYVYSANGQPVIYDLLSQGQGSLRAWLNGKPLYNSGDNVDINHFGGRVQLPLQKGWNRLLILNAKTLATRKSWWITGSFYGQQQDAIETHGVVWSTFTPSPGSSSPVIAGDRIFFTAEKGSVVCANKADGKLLWIRSVSYHDFATDEERKTNPEVFAELDPRAEQVKQLDQSDLANPWKPPSLEKDFRYIVDEPLYFKGMSKVSKEKYNNPATWGCEAGYTAHTPITDGQRVYALFGSGILVCYDLDGNRKWMKLLKHTMVEHGYTTSPLLLDGKLVIYFDDFTVLDAKTGAVVLERPRSKQAPPYRLGLGFSGTPCVLTAGNERVLFYPSGEFVRLSDGKMLAIDENKLAALGFFEFYSNKIASPVVENGICYFVAHNCGGARAFKLSPLQGDKVDPEIVCTAPFTLEKFPYYYESWYDASPLVHEGLLYCVNSFGTLSVVDMVKGELLYQRQLDIEIFMPYNGGLLKGGACASPTLAGKYIYIWGNQGTCIVLEPGRAFKQVARLRLESSLNGRQEATMTNPVFEGERMYYRAEYTLNCIGPK